MALSELRQALVRNGFAGCLPSKTTHNSAELNNLFRLFGFYDLTTNSASLDSLSGSNSEFSHLFYEFRPAPSIRFSTPEERIESRMLIYKSGYPELDRRLFREHDDDFNSSSQLQTLNKRSGEFNVNNTHDIDLDTQLGEAAKRREYKRILSMLSVSRTLTPEHAALGLYSAIEIKDKDACKEYIWATSELEELRGINHILKAVVDAIAD